MDQGRTVKKLNSACKDFVYGQCSIYMDLCNVAYCNTLAIVKKLSKKLREALLIIGKAVLIKRACMYDEKHLILTAAFRRLCKQLKFFLSSMV